MNEIARGINARRNEFEAIVNEFRAVWSKVYRNELNEAYKSVCERLKGVEAKSDEERALKNERYALEQVLAKIKSLTLTADERDMVRTMHDEDGLTLNDLTKEYIIGRLNETSYVREFVREDGTTIACLQEMRKNKDTGEKEWRVVERWTVMKVGRYFRLANIA